jgi:hypothetical protein
MENADRLFPRVIARSLVDHGQSHEIDHDEIDYEAAISTPGLPRHCCPVERVRSRRQPDGFLVMTQMETLLPSSQTPGPWKSPLERGGSRYSQIDDNYSQIDYIWETGCVAAFVPAPAMRLAGATHPVPPDWCRAGHPSQEGTCGSRRANGGLWIGAGLKERKRSVGQGRKMVRPVSGSTRCYLGWSRRP